MFNKYKDYQCPVLKLLVKLGGSAAKKVTIQQFKVHYGAQIPKKHYRIAYNNKPLWNIIVSWAGYELKKKGYLIRSSGTWTITKIGYNYLKSSCRDS